MTFSFPAHIFKDTDSYGVRFPDVPGCFSCGDSIEEALNNAAEALSLHLEGFIEDGTPVPEATKQFTLDSPNDIYALISCDVDEAAVRPAG